MGKPKSSRKKVKVAAVIKMAMEGKALTVNLKALTAALKRSPTRSQIRKVEMIAGRALRAELRLMVLALGKALNPKTTPQAAKLRRSSHPRRRK